MKKAIFGIAAFVSATLATLIGTPVFCGRTNACALQLDRLLCRHHFRRRLEPPGG
jgi:hypothetical protein